MINNSLFTSNTDLWATPQSFFNELDKEFHFTLDVCATKDNAKCDRYYTKEDDGLSKSWDNEIIWMNPPYGKEIGKWIKKASEQVGGVCICLLPSRTDTRYFHEYIYNKPNVEIRFIKGRLKIG
jgi:site-specific DNA-methyltransferase (adenine-specific)